MADNAKLVNKIYLFKDVTLPSLPSQSRIFAVLISASPLCFFPLVCHEHIMSKTDRYVCIFPQCQNLLNNNEFTRYNGFNGSDWLDTPTCHGNPSRNSFIPIFIANTIILTFISNNIHHNGKYIYVYLSVLTCHTPSYPCSESFLKQPHEIQKMSNFSRIFLVSLTETLQSVS